MDSRSVKLPAGLSAQLKNRLPKKPESKRPQPYLTGVDAEKFDLRIRRTNDPFNPLRFHSYLMHRYRVQMMHPVVDTSPPLVARNHYSKPSNFNRRLVNFTRIERENAMMVRRISKILEGQSMLDNKLSWIGSGEAKGGRTRQMKLLDTALENLALLKRLQEMKPVIDTQKLLADYKKNEDVMERLSYYPLFWKRPVLKGWEAYIDQATSRGPEVSVYLDLATDTEFLGRIVIALNFAVTPMTSENFMTLVTGDLGISYKCSQIHRIVPGILWQGGDVTGQEGFGNKAIYGNTFPDENFVLKHDSPGIVSMANCGPNSNGSQFLITARPTPALDGTNVVFGKVTSGMDVLNKLITFVRPDCDPNDLSNCGVGFSTTPNRDIFIKDCGVMEGSSKGSVGIGKAVSDKESDLEMSPDKTNLLENEKEL